MPSWLPDLDDMRMQRWAELIEQRTGVHIPPERKTFMAVGLRSCMRDVGVEDYDSYYRILTGRYSWSREWSALVDRITVHETSFFRHPPSLALLAEEILPRFFARQDVETRGFQAWSIGCSTGEEAYTLAMLLDDYLHPRAGRELFGVTATDISDPALNVARDGVYAVHRLMNVPDSLRQHYFDQITDDVAQVVGSLRRRVCFARLNVARLDGFPLRDLDLIYCQNMLIYFARDRRRQLLDELAQRLAPGGVLVLGPGDVAGWSHPELERIRFEGALAYRRFAGERGNA